jgi:hypothetical protein
MASSGTIVGISVVGVVIAGGIYLWKSGALGKLMDKLNIYVDEC